jgi:putative oxidoreductase
MNADLALLLLRVVIGVIFFGHGAQKVLGWWGGPGPTGWRTAMGRMGFEPREFWALVSSGTEFIGGALFALGFLTPLVAAFLIAQSIVIIGKVHFPKGFWNAQGGFEFPLSLLAAVLAVAIAGPGAYSADAAFSLLFSDTFRLALIVLGIIAGAVALAVPRLTSAGDTPAASS